MRVGARQCFLQGSGITRLSSTVVLSVGFSSPCSNLPSGFVQQRCSCHVYVITFKEPDFSTVRFHRFIFCYQSFVFLESRILPVTFLFSVCLSFITLLFPSVIFLLFSLSEFLVFTASPVCTSCLFIFLLCQHGKCLFSAGPFFSSHNTRTFSC